MNREDKSRLLLLIILTVLSIIFTRWFFNAVYYSELPAWIKYMILS